MLRHIKQWWGKAWGDILIHKRVTAVSSELREHFGLSENPRMTRIGGREYDNIYKVSHGDRTLGVLRLVNPYKKSKEQPPHRLFMVMDAEKRIDYEWAMYTKGAAHNLTPKPLWRTHDALLCEHLPYGRMQDTLLESPGEAWNILCRAARATRRLHEAGITHMDVWLQNMLGDAQGNIYFIDFEYMPAPYILPPVQRIYDHLRLIEAAWKFIPEDKKADFGVWLDYFTSCLDDEMRQVDLSLIERDLSRVLEEKELGTRIRQLFTNRLL